MTAKIGFGQGNVTNNDGASFPIKRLSRSEKETNNAEIGVGSIVRDPNSKSNSYYLVCEQPSEGSQAKLLPLASHDYVFADIKDYNKLKPCRRLNVLI